MPLRTLIVDDDPTNLKLASAVLSCAGHDVQVARDAESALSMIRHALPDLILLDIQLPIMDGLTLARIIKADDKISAVRIIALTAFAMKSDELRALEAGCDGYLSKPIDAEIFPEQIEQHLLNFSAKAASL